MQALIEKMTLSMRKSREENYKFGTEEGHREGDEGSGWRYEFGFATNDQYNALIFGNLNFHLVFSFGESTETNILFKLGYNLCIGRTRKEYRKHGENSDRRSRQNRKF